MKKNTNIIIGASALIIVASAIILSVKLSKSRKLKKDCEQMGGEWNRKKKKCLSEEGTTVVVDEQTKGDVGAKVNVHPTLKYTNVRSSPELNNGSNCWWGVCLSGTSNKIGEVTSSPVGTITKAETGSDDYTWYKIKLNRTLEGKSTGYVREDSISFT